jgi:hypothetical protein
MKEGQRAKPHPADFNFRWNIPRSCVLDSMSHHAPDIQALESSIFRPALHGSPAVLRKSVLYHLARVQTKSEKPSTSLSQLPTTTKLLGRKACV